MHPVLLLLLIGAMGSACAHRPCPPEIPMQARPRMEPALVRAIEETPDATVGVLVRTTRPPEGPERRALAEAGLRVGTVAGDIVTGRLRACDAIRVAALDFVRTVQRADEVMLPVPPSPI